MKTTLVTAAFILGLLAACGGGNAPSTPVAPPAEKIETPVTKPIDAEIVWPDDPFLWLQPGATSVTQARHMQQSRKTGWCFALQLARMLVTAGAQSGPEPANLKALCNG